MATNGDARKVEPCPQLACSTLNAHGKYQPALLGTRVSKGLGCSRDGKVRNNRPQMLYTRILKDKGAKTSLGWPTARWAHGQMK
jgi:hypothetical protein